jgi:hypothetical protein
MVVGLGATLFLSYELHSVLARIFGPSQPPPPAAVAA